MTFKYHSNGTVDVEKRPGMGVSVYQTRPKTMGTVTLRSPNPSDKAVCSPHFLTDPYDISAMISGVRQIRQIMTSQPIASRVIAEDIPGTDILTNDDICHFMQDTGNSAHHQGGTCKMGRDDAAVVDERLRVRGIERLRVVDASVMPHLTSGNTNAPTIMIGIKGGDMIRQDAVARRPVEFKQGAV